MGATKNSRKTSRKTRRSRWPRGAPFAWSQASQRLTPASGDAARLAHASASLKPRAHAIVRSLRHHLSRRSFVPWQSQQSTSSRFASRSTGTSPSKNLSLQVPRGSVYGLLGPNGAGKTTTIRMILDIIEPDSGTISVFGQPSISGRDGNRIGYLPEERGLYKKMQVRRVLKFLAELKGVRGREADKRIESGSSASRSPAARRTGEAPRSTSCRAACSRRCSSSARCCTSPTSSSSTSRSAGSIRSTRRRSRTRSSTFAARQDGHLQHAPHGQRRTAVRLGVHHRARRQGARRHRRRRESRARRPLHRASRSATHAPPPSPTSSPIARSSSASTTPIAPSRSSSRRTPMRSCCCAGSSTPAPSSSASSSCSRRCTRSSSTRSARRASKRG